MAQQVPNQIPDGDIDDDESAATEVADGNDGKVEDSSWNQIIEVLWAEYDKDNSGYLDKAEMAPLAAAALE